MRQARRLLPYAGLSAFVVIASVVALLLSALRMPVGGRDTSPSVSPSASAAVRPATDLSPNGRLAYWRSEPNGDYLLWVSNVDNSRRRRIASADRPAAVSRTRWSAAGNAVSYIDGGGRLVVVGLDGTQTMYVLPAELRQGGFHIVDQHFSPSGERIAATVQHASLPEYDVMLSTAAGGWTRLTTTQDVTASDWITEDEVLVATTRGVIGRLDVNGTDRLTALTSVAGASPLIGDDGRVHFIADPTGTAATNGPPQVSSDIRVWNVTVDGDDLRREALSLAAVPQGGFALDATWPGGYLVHRGLAGDQLIAVGAGLGSFPGSAGTILRVALAPDHRSAIGFTPSSIVRFDLNANGGIASTVTFLGSVDQGDAWFPRTVTLAHVPRPANGVPAARYVFTLGAHLWTMGADGHAQLFDPRPTVSGMLPAPPAWSPSGDRALSLQAVGVAATTALLLPVVASRDRSALVVRGLGPVTGTLTWSPDGTHFAAVGLGPVANDFAALPRDLMVSTIDASTGAIANAMPGRAAYWTAAGIVVLSNGTYRAGDRARDDQAIELWNEGTKRELTSIAALAADPRSHAPVQHRGIVQSDRLSATSDGAYVAIHLSFATVAGAGGANPTAFAIIRARDGAATAIITNESVNDEAWSSSGKLLGYTRYPAAPPYGVPQHAVVRDADTNGVLLDVEGRFAGWSPDGSWVLVARADGLFARPLGGGDLVKVAPYDVLVSATKP